MSGRIFAIGDIHGCFGQLRTLVDEIIKPGKDDKLIFLGDYIDRGEQTKEVIDFIIDLTERGYDIVPLMGNHEAMLLDALENNENMWIWFQNGGYETVRSFGLRSINDLDKHYVSFFRALRFYFPLDNFLFVHAGFSDELHDPFEDRHTMVWTRNEVYNNPLLKDKIIIHGHTPITLSQCRERVASGKHILNIDTGCVYKSSPGYGRLTALEIKSYRLLSV